jgi:excisionase family DNA binding protein
MPARRPNPEPEPVPVDDDRLNMPAACQFLGVGRSTLQSLMYAGQIGYLKVGKRVQFERTELRRYLAGCRAGVGR